MIQKLDIENFKSIKKLHVPCKKVNVFIGEPNSGKSNILEALSFFSPGTLENDTVNEVIRFKTIGDLFYDYDYNKTIKIETDIRSFHFVLARNDLGAVFNSFSGLFFNPNYDEDFDSKEVEDAFRVDIDHAGKIGNRLGNSANTNFRTYIFKRPKSFSVSYQNFLAPPFGQNIPNLLISNTELKKMVSDLFKEKGFRLQIKPVENEILISKEVDDELYSYPYYTVSDTLQRIVFMMLAIESNKNAILSFDEPEANTFPFYTKYIAERIALDETNQFFITTHNPYLLSNIIEKTKLNDLNVFVTKMENFETKIYPLTSAQIESAFDMGSDVFFNLDNLIAE